MNHIAEDILMHYGMPRRSGRYPYGSGEDPYQHGIDFLGRVEELRKKNLTYTDDKGKTFTGDTAIAKTLNMTTGQFRTELSIAKTERRMLNVARAKALREKGLGDSAIGREMGVNESTVRSWFKESSEARMNKAMETANILRDAIETKGMIDIGAGVERELRVSKEKLKEAAYILEREGYKVYGGGIPQVTNAGKQINQTIIGPKNMQPKDIYQYDKIHTLHEYTSDDGGATFRTFQYPKSLDSKRLKVLLADEIGPDGEPGIAKDGIIQIRRGVEDLSLGNSKYAQVRILVDDTKYLKGMAVYSDNMPDGVDVLFNSNKTSIEKALKDIKKDDPNNPFGSLIKANGQSEYIDKNGKKQLSLINKRADEGDWEEWANAVPSQFLGKQPMSLIKKQLNLAKADKMAEYEDICNLTNPTIKKHLLEEFASNCDSAAVHLKAAALPGQKYHVIIPVNTLKDTEVYAPGYANGTKVALVRYPHGGTFEIPILTVNNKHTPAKNLIGNDAIDAVCINKKNADRLSGADFDGDTVMVIPTHDAGNKVKISSTPRLEGLENFDPHTEYAAVPGMKYMTKKGTQKEMGVISNLITDMTLAGATSDELARAVRHSMVVIDAEKHKLNYKQSEFDNNIAALKKQYQIHIDENGNEKYGGASTILSKAKSQAPVPKRRGQANINQKGKPWYDPSKPEGALIYKASPDAYYPERTYDKTTGQITVRLDNGKKITYNSKDKAAADLYNPVKRIDEATGKVTFTDKTGTLVYRTKTRTENSTKMAETDDAMTLVSTKRNPKELEYANYANYMKDLANKARLEMVNTGKIEYSKQAKATYSQEVIELNRKLNEALLNAPKEREAQRRANAEILRLRESNPSLDNDKDALKKAKQRALSDARKSVGSISRKDRNIDITDREWEAIQAGAVSEQTLKDILRNTDPDVLRERATPRTNSNTLSPAKINRAKALSASNHTISDIAEMLGVSTSVVSKYLKGKE